MTMPAAFLKNDGILCGLQALPAIKYFAQWNEPRSGFNACVTAAVNLEASSLNMIHHLDAELLAVLKHLVTNACPVTLDILVSMGWYFLPLTQRRWQFERLSEAWEIVSQSVRALFDQLQTICATAQDSVSMTDDTTISCANVAWAIYQTHRVLDEMMA